MKFAWNILVCIFFGVVFFSSPGLSGGRGGFNGNARVVGSNQFFYFYAYEEIEENIWVEIHVQGSIHTTVNGDEFVTWMWIIGDNNSIELIPVTPNTVGDPYYDTSIFTIGSRRVIYTFGVNYPKQSTTTNRKSDSPQPIPDGVVLLERPPPSPSLGQGWNWAGWMVTLQYLEGGRGGSQCDPPDSGPNGERYTIPLNDREVLIIIITADGTITILLYRLGDDGCWRFGASPDTYEPPPLPGSSVAQTLPLVYAEYLAQLANGEFEDAPPFPN
ncbi:hypothetical protein H8D29_05070 [PVC group bacterium]|nr:hypothetical protein [PVC group bacterium]